MYAGNKSAKNHDGFLGNGGQHVIVVTFKTSKRSWATAGQNQNSIVEFLDLFLNEFCMIFYFYIIVAMHQTSSRSWAKSKFIVEFFGMFLSACF